MKKWSMIALAALCLALPARGGAQELPRLFEAVGEGLAIGLEEGARMAAASLGEELTLGLSLSRPRMERGETAELIIEAGNPRAQETPVRFEILLPQRLGAQGELVFEAVLPPAQIDDATGALEPSKTTFVREIALLAGGESEQVRLACEMSMGTRFYRAAADLAICIADVSVSAEALGTDAGRLRPGDSFTYRIEAVNAGMAAQDVGVEMILPQGMTLCGALPEGLNADGQRIAGSVTAEAAGEEPAVLTMDVPVRVDASVLDGDADGQAVLGGVLYADGERVALPKVQVVAPRVSARLIPAQDSVAAGDTMEMEIVVVNAGLAGADVELTCLLPAGLELAAQAVRATQDEAEREDEADGAPVSVRSSGDGGARGGAAPVPAGETPAEPDILARTDGNGTVVYTLRMDAARETEAGVSASSVSIPLRVRAQADEEQAERMVGASLLCRADGGESRLSEAAAIRIYNRGFLGLSGSEWNAIFWAALLMTATVVCLYAATRPEKKEEYVFD